MSSVVVVSAVTLIMVKERAHVILYLHSQHTTTRVKLILCKADTGIEKEEGSLG